MKGYLKRRRRFRRARHNAALLLRRDHLAFVQALVAIGDQLVTGLEAAGHLYLVCVSLADSDHLFMRYGLAVLLYADEHIFSRLIALQCIDRYSQYIRSGIVLDLYDGDLVGA